ncbi:MAG: glycosyltransferase [Cyclobacteriaceae bacterium]|nr:glycosyltransferase [Cyclobacteriaceae bacterium]
MQEIKKRRIVLASVLKPLNDPRMLEKLAMSLHNAGYRDIHIIGFPTKLTREIHSGIIFHPLRAFTRLSVQRMLASWKILLTVISLKPALFIITTHELLFAAIVLKVLTRCRIVYDIQENYYKNILGTNAFPRLLRYPIAFYVRLKEKMMSPFFDALFLAEKCYREELRFAGKHHVLLENKCVVPKDFKRTPTASGTTLLFTGTLAKSTGIFEAIDLAEKLHQADAKIRLHIVGYCAMHATWEQLKLRIAGHPFIQLSGGRELQPHDVIMEAIGHATFGIVYYPPAPHTRNRIPTKLFEYLACGLPVLLQNDKHLTAIADSVDGAIAVDFDNVNAADLIHKMSSVHFYSSPSTAFIWETEKTLLINQIQEIFHDQA